MSGSFDAGAFAIYCLGRAKFVLGRMIGISLLLMAFAGSIGFDDRLHFLRAPKTLIPMHAFSKGLGALGIVGMGVFLLSMDQNTFLCLGMAAPVAAAKEQIRPDVWRERNRKNQKEKRAVKRQAFRMKDKVLCLQDKQLKAEQKAELERRKAVEKEAINCLLKKRLNESSSQLTMLTEQHSTLVKEHGIAKKEINSVREVLSQDVEKIYLRKERSPYSIKFAAKIIKIALIGTCFRSMTRMLENLSLEGLFEYRAPCSTSIANWVCQAGLGSLMQPKKLNEPYIMIIDHCTAIGGVKLFVALAVTKSAYEVAAKGERALGLDDMTFLDMVPMLSSNATEMCAIYKRLIEQVGRSSEFILSDRGSDLIAGLRMYRTLTGDLVEHLHDFSHKAANLLKAKYGKEPWLKEFTEVLHSGSAKLRQGRHAHLTAPAIRGKARFMNISSQLLWAKKVFTLTAGRGRPEQGSQKHVLQQAYPELRRFEKPVCEFLKESELIEKMATILKKSGYSPTTHKQCMDLIKHFNQIDPLIEGLCDWLNECKMLRIRLQKSLAGERWDLPLPISSDPIESLFSRYKSLISRMPIQEPTRCTLLLPLLVGNPGTDVLAKYFASTTNSDVKRWVEKNLPKSQIKKRQELAKEIQVLAIKTGDKTPPERLVQQAS